MTEKSTSDRTLSFTPLKERERTGPPGKKVLLAFSGGMDSTALLGLLAEDPTVEEIHCCVFTYGAKNQKYENAAAVDVINYYRKAVPDKMPNPQYIDIKPVMQNFRSTLLMKTREEVPEGHYAADEMKAMIVPSRNLIFASIMAGLADSIGATHVVMGIQQGPTYSIYPDCRAEFVKALDLVVYLASDRTVRVECPFLFDDKKDILRKTQNLKIPVPYHLTRTCFKDQKKSCGKCGACNKRLEAFAAMDLEDPAEYQEE